MRPEEISALGELAAGVAAGTTERVREVHAGIAGRIFGAIGAGALPVRIAHDAVTGLVYTGAREATRAAVKAGTLAARSGSPPQARSIEESPIGRRLLGVLNGAIGDRLERQDSPLALRMTLRVGDRDVSPIPEALRDAYAPAAPRLAVFVHGLAQTDEAWLVDAERHVPYGYRLQTELGYTPLYVRYNTGRHVSENGRELAGLLDRVIAGWPTDLTEVVLVGHAMGGLVARAACHYGSGMSWSRRVHHVLMLGAPHTGAPLEQLTGAAGGLLRRLPETRAVARAIEQRSAGIKDMRYGYVVDEDWAEGGGTRRPRDVPFLSGAKHYFVSAGALGPDLLLVTPKSAWARRGNARVRFPADHYAHIDGVSHFGLLNHPAVYGQMYWWLCSSRALPAARGTLPAGQRP